MRKMTKFKFLKEPKFKMTKHNYRLNDKIKKQLKFHKKAKKKS
jgi:hypothetical protein